jgi:hypothetical protein
MAEMGVVTTCGVDGSHEWSLRGYDALVCAQSFADRISEG